MFCGSEIMRLLCAAAIVTGFAGPVLAEDCVAPCVGSKLTLEIMDEWTRWSHSGSRSSVEAQPHVEFETTLIPFENMKLVNNVIVERVIDPLPGTNSVFRDVGGYVAELYAELELDPVTLKFGKYDPVFSLMADVGSGIHAVDLAENVEMTGSIVGQSSFVFETFDMKQELAAAVFSNDRLLDKSAFTYRPVLRLRDGGAGNTSGLSSVQAILDGCMGADADACSEDGSFGYRLGARFQRHGRALPVEDGETPVRPENEVALLAALSGNLSFNDMTLRILGEEVFLHHAAGSPDDALIMTGQLALVDGPLTYSTTLSRQWNNVKAAPDTTESLAELAVEYAPEDDQLFDGTSWSVAASYVIAKDEAKQMSQTLAFKFIFDLSGSQALR
jgi:hypothetical protein